MAPSKEVAGAAGIAVLPDEALIHCLSFLTLSERIKMAALVSKRLRALCFAPELLSYLEVKISGPAVLDRCQALLHFFTAHGQHVTELDLYIELPEDSSSAQKAELQMILSSCLAVCGVTRTLQVLYVSDHTPLASLAWLPTLTNLQHVQLGSEDSDLRLPSGLSKLTKLISLDLTGSTLAFDPVDRRLPTSLCKLRMAGCTGTALAEQVLHLTNLHHLTLARNSLHGSSLDVLTRLTRLHTLVLSELEQLPASLSRLTWLKQLEVSRQRPMALADLATLDAALGSLQQLTCLALGTKSLMQIPPAVGHLRQLQRLLFWNPDTHLLNSGVPEGPWLASLRWLGVPWPTACLSLRELAAIPQLEHLCIMEVPGLVRNDTIDGNGALWRGFWDFAATHPPLRRLSFDILEGDTAPTDFKLLDEVMVLAGKRPGLKLVRTGMEDSTFWGQMTV